MIINILRWIAVLALAFVAGKLMTKIKMPSILGWLIIGMIFGPHALAGKIKHTGKHTQEEIK